MERGAMDREAVLGGIGPRDGVGAGVGWMDRDPQHRPFKTQPQRLLSLCPRPGGFRADWGRPRAWPWQWDLSRGRRASTQGLLLSPCSEP